MGVTLLASAFLAVSTFIVRFFSYCHDLAIVQYWSLDISLIQPSNENLIYYILFSATMCALLFLGSWVLTLFFSTKPKNISPFAHIVFLSVFTIFFSLFLSFVYVVLFFSSWSIQAYLYSLAFTGLNVAVALISRAVMYCLKGSFESTFTSYPIQSMVSLAILLMVACSFASYHTGFSSADSQRTFPLLNDTQVVVYSTSTTYYTARYTIDGDTILIDTSHRGTYARADGELEYRTFEDVILQD